MRVIDRMEGLGFDLVRVEIGENGFGDLLGSYVGIVEQFSSCLQCTIRGEFDDFLSDSSVFGSDAPFKNFGEFYVSDLQQDYWVKYWKRASEINLKDCSPFCGEFLRLRNGLKEKVEKWLVDMKLDFMIAPTAPDLAPILEEYPSNRLGAALVFSYSTLNVFNVPIGFSQASREAPDRLPFGVSFIAPQEKLMHAFRLA